MRTRATSSGASNRLGWKDLAKMPTSGSVLIVDDDPDMRRGLQRLVTKLGYSTQSAASAETADIMLAQSRFDACVLDIDLPRMKGVEFLDWALARDPEMGVIMLTGLDSPDLAIECIEAGASTYLVKPVDASFLRLALRHAFATRRLLVERNNLVGRG